MSLYYGRCKRSNYQTYYWFLDHELGNTFRFEVLFELEVMTARGPYPAQKEKFTRTWEWLRKKGRRMEVACCTVCREEFEDVDALEKAGGRGCEKWDAFVCGHCKCGCSRGRCILQD